MTENFVPRQALPASELNGAFAGKLDVPVPFVLGGSYYPPNTVLYSGQTIYLCIQPVIQASLTPDQDPTHFQPVSTGLNPLPPLPVWLSDYVLLKQSDGKFHLVPLSSVATTILLSSSNRLDLTFVLDKSTLA